MFLIGQLSTVSLRNISNHNKTSGMVSRASLSFLFIAILVVGTKQSNVKSWESILSSSGILVLKIRNAEHCRSCLIEIVGVDRITLVEATSHSYTYSIEGRITMLESFLRQCHGVNYCVIENRVRYYQRLSFVEYKINKLAMQIDSAVYKSLTLEREKQSDAYVHERCKTFFYKEMEAQYDRRNQCRVLDCRDQPQVIDPIIYSKFLFEKLLQITISTTGTEAHQNTLSYRKITGRCFHSSKASFQCEKCIAVHSTSFGLRIYTYKSYKKSLRTLFAFSTAHSQDTICDNCYRQYCPLMQWISEAACEKLDLIFPNDNRILYDVGTAAMKLYNKAYSTIDCMDPAHENSCGSISISQNIDFRVMMLHLDANSVSAQKIGRKKNLKVTPHETLILEQFLEASTISCAFVSTAQTARLLFLNCIINLAGNKGILLLSSVSVSNMILLYDSSVVPHDHFITCQNRDSAHLGEVILLLMDNSQCNDYRTQHKSNPIVYPELSMVKSILPQKKICLFILNTRKGEKMTKCDACLEALLRRNGDITRLIHEPRSQLWRIFNEQKTWSAIDQVLTRCVHKGPFKSMMLLPEMLCSEHEQYSPDMMAEGVRMNEKNMIEFDRLKVELWPHARIASNAHGNFDDRGVFMVEFEAVNTKDCVSCIVHKQEVFFVYAPPNYRFGYLWMTQSIPRILRMCISEQSCIRLASRKEGKQLDTRKGMTPWSSLELESLFGTK